MGKKETMYIYIHIYAEHKKQMSEGAYKRSFAPYTAHSLEFKSNLQVGGPEAATFSDTKPVRCGQTKPVPHLVPVHALLLLALLLESILRRKVELRNRFAQTEEVTAQF